MSTQRREDSLYKHKYRELLKTIEDIEKEVKEKQIEYRDFAMKHKGEGSLLMLVRADAYGDVLKLIDGRINVKEK